MTQFFLKCQAVPQKSVDNCRSSAEIQRSQIWRIDSDIKAGNGDITGTSAKRRYYQRTELRSHVVWGFRLSQVQVVLCHFGSHSYLCYIKRDLTGFPFCFVWWFARFAVICQSPHIVPPPEETSEEYWVSRWVWRLNYSLYCNAESSLRQVFTNSQDCFWDRDAIWSRAIYPCVNMSKHHFFFL